MRQLICEICDEAIASFDPADMSLPIHGGMFRPKQPGYPMPWPDPAHLLDWESMRCPYCRFRPIVDEARLLTPLGYYEIGAEVVLPPIELEPDPERLDALKAAEQRIKEKRRGKRKR